MKLQVNELWWRHMRWPIAAFVCLALLFESTDLDRDIAKLLFFDADGRTWIGATSFWANTVLHTGGRWFVRVLVLTAAATWVASFLRSDLRHLRRPSAYFVAAVTLSVSSVGLLKSISPVHCPWDLLEFGGRFAVTHWFESVPQAAGHCFPAAHSSSGYALLALYFTYREFSTSWSRFGIVAGLALGVVFGFAQQSRGAHFASHDVWSVFIVWLVATSLYVFGFAGRLKAGQSIAKQRSNESMAVGGDAMRIDRGDRRHLDPDRTSELAQWSTRERGAS